MKDEKLEKIHFIGIGGIGMSALASYFILKNKKVSGYDKIQSPITEKLKKEGATIFHKDELHLIDNIEKIDLVVYTPAISENKQLKYFQENNFRIQKRSEVLGNISNIYQTIAVAGTHGKTTTCSIIAHILKVSNQHGACFIGGVTTNYDSNFLFGKGNLSVIEADEFDKSFLKLNPDSIVLTSMDADHLDIYKTEENIQNNFVEFAKKLEDKRKLIVEEKISPLFQNNLSYGFNEFNDLQVLNVKIINGCYQFNIKYKKEIFDGFSLKMLGNHNLLNTAGAILSCLEVGISLEIIKNALNSYSGVKRRFELHLNNTNFVYIDDYAHHPNEITSLLVAVKEFYPEKKIIGVFQPHLYSRTRDFLNEFAQSLAVLDQLFLLPIYAAREKQIQGVTSSALLELIKIENKKLIESKFELFKDLNKEEDFLLLTIGAGDIDLWVNDILKYLKTR